MFVKVPKLRQNFEKIGFGKLLARAKFRRRGVKRNWKAYRATVDPIVSSKERQTHAVNSKKRKWKTKVPKVCICESSKIVADFWENWARGEKPQNCGRFLGKFGFGVKSPKLWQIFGKIGLGKLRARAKFRRHFSKLNWETYKATAGQVGIEPPTDPDRPYCICLVVHWLGRREIFPKNITFLGNSQKSSKFSTSEQGAQEVQTEFVFAQTEFVFVKSPKIVADF